MKLKSCFVDQIQYEPVPNTENEKTGNEKWRWIFKFNKYWAIIFVLAAMMFIADFFELKSLSFKDMKNIELLPSVQPPTLRNLWEGYAVNTPGCRIPDMDPFDATVKEFVKPPGKLKCNEKMEPLFDSNATSLYMLTSSLHFYNAKNSTDLKCCYKEFTRLDPKGSDEDNGVKYTACQQIGQDPVNINDNSEYIRVNCQNSEGKIVYDDFFAFAPIKKQNLKFSHSKKSKPNILIVGIDAVSRLNLHRTMPKTYKYVTEELQAIELLGYNKVADNTFVNLIPVFTGMFEEELIKSCWPNKHDHFDNCPFLWKNYSTNNYLTAVGEDCAAIGLFYYQKYGFKKQTSDYYYTTFAREAEDKIGTDKDFNCRQCVGARESYKLIVDYIKKFTRTMLLKSAPYFAFFWTNNMSHDYLNRPALGDDSYYNLFKTLKEIGSLNDTILILMSDHGIRWGDIRQTYQGQMEERLPFVIMALPEWFKDDYPQAILNLKKNVRKLTTPFDLHETLKELLDVNNLENPRNNLNSSISRGYSLFSQIPKTRTCKDAEIASHWCTCQQSNDLSTNNSEVVSAAKFAVEHINSQLTGYAQCATLELVNISNARVSAYNDITNKKSLKDYTVILQTQPGGGVFESENPNSMGKMMQHFTVTGTISRLNLYGNQSNCITDFHLKLYCYCTNLLNL